MAVILDAFASKLLGIIADMAKEEVEMLLGVPGEITKLQTTLGDLSRIVANAERRRIRDTAVEHWVRDLKDIMYDADDILDLCQIMDMGGEEATTGCCPTSSMLSCFRNPIAAHEIGKKIQELNKRLEEIQKRSSRFGFISQTVNHSPSFSLQVDMNRKTGSAIIRSDVVGENIEEHVSKLVNLLINKAEGHAGSQSTKIAVVAIAGTGGIGKTTLARMIFSDNRVQENFDKRIWLSVNQGVDEMAVLRSAIAQLGSSHEGPATDKAMLHQHAEDKALLEQDLMRVVRQKKFFLVMDDVWSAKVWNELLRVPLDDRAPGSRVLVTTRNDGVALAMKTQHIHHVHKLNLEDAWSLLKKQVVLNDDDKVEVDMLEDIGKEIVERCDGLPLAVKVVGGLLLSKNRTRSVWRDISNHFAWSLPAIKDDINNAFYLSYEELPSHLKQCFIHCSLLPNDVVCHRSDIVHMWVAEGFIQDNISLKLPEDLGDEYYKELILRNLLEPDDVYYDQSRCTMHDVVRSFAQSVAKDEGLFVNKGQNVSSDLATLKLRRLSISNKEVKWVVLQKKDSLRTLMLFQSPTMDTNDLWNNLSHLRILHLCDPNIMELPQSIHQLRHLRYLGLSGTGISAIPQDIGKLKFLQFINLNSCENLSQLPNSILELQKLRSLDIGRTRITSMPRGFGKLVDLLIMCGFATHLDDGIDGWCSLEELGSLSKLRNLAIHGLEKASSGSMVARAKLSNKTHLKCLSLSFTSRLKRNGEVKDNISKEEQEQIEEVLGNLQPPPCIEVLTIFGYFGHQLPQWMVMMPAFENLRQLVLEDYACCKELPNGLGLLPFLDYLEIDRGPSVECIRNDFLVTSFSGYGDGKRQHRSLSPGARATFPKLKILRFIGMLEWREWDWEEQVQAMPILGKLSISHCKLRHLPPGLACHARALTSLYLENVSHLVSVENFPSLVELWVYDNPKLERITKNPSLQKTSIFNCPALRVLGELPALRSIVWQDFDAEALPQYFEETKLNNLHIDCSLSLLKLISLQDASSEWEKIQHVQQVTANGFESQDETCKGSVMYTKEPNYFEIDIIETETFEDECEEGEAEE